jgi:protein-disulfide isomerase
LAGRKTPAIFGRRRPDAVSPPRIALREPHEKPIRFAAAAARAFRRVAPTGVIALALSAASVHAQNAAPAASAAPATAPIDPLMAPGPLPDIVEGSPSAAITIIEYASMTCSHCATFHEETWPLLKAKYVDSGKAKFILREFPLDPLVPGITGRRNTV